MNRGSDALDVLDASHWERPLLQFAQGSGLCVCLFDGARRLRCGPRGSSPLAEHLIGAGLWKPGGVGLEVDAELAGAAMKEGTFVEDEALGCLRRFAVPAYVDGLVIGAFVAGWIFDHFADPLETDRLSRRIGSAATELWAVVRQQPPVSRERLRVLADLLSTLGEAILRALANQQRERETSNTLRVLNEAARAMSGASSAQQIGVAVLEAALELTSGIEARLLVPDDSGGARELANIKREPSLGADGGPERIGWLRLPLGHGAIEVARAGSFPDEALRPELLALASQASVALEKASLLEDLERERLRLERALAELERAARLKDEFLATVSHELRTPLNAMLGWAKMLSSGGLDETKRERGLATIERNALAQVRLIDDLLDASRIVAGKLQLKSRPLDLVDVIRRGIDAVGPAAEAKRIRIDAQLEDGPIPFNGDPDRLQQVIWNLLSNAVKFTPTGGVVTIRAEHSKTGPEIEIRDTGKGIPPAFLPHVFDRFSQADSSSIRAHGGLGLGLAIVRHLVELHGGTVTASSDGDGRGASFVVRLPEYDVVPAPEDSRPVLQVADLQGARILIVDDDPDAREWLQTTLESSGADVCSVASAAEAFASVSLSPPDILIADFAMPVEDGFSLMRRIRALADGRAQAVPSIALSAYARRADHEAALAAGFQRYLGKPVDPAVLLAAVAELRRSSTRP